MTDPVDTRPNPSGLCMCGCGEPTGIASANNATKGWVKGEHKRYINHHNWRPTHDDRRYRVEDCGYETPCWVWQMHIQQPQGYGRMAAGPGTHRLIYAHRYFYEKHVGPIPTGLHIDHLCRNRACVNPEHLEPVTQQENTRRGVEARTHCRHGHEYTPDSVYFYPNGRRRCRVCRDEYQRAYRKAA